MKRIVKSRQTGIFCTQCDKSIPVNTSRIIDGGMHSHYECLNKFKNVKTAKTSTLGRLVSWIKRK